jgi:hypothetical protein
MRFSKDFPRIGFVFFSAAFLSLFRILA